MCTAKNYFRQVSAEKEGEEGEGPVKLPVRWMALESLHDGTFTEKTDVVGIYSNFIAFSEYGYRETVYFLVYGISLILIETMCFTCILCSNNTNNTCCYTHM